MDDQVARYHEMLEMGCYRSLQELVEQVDPELLDEREWHMPINGDTYAWYTTSRWQIGQCPIFALALWDELKDEGWELVVDADDFGLQHCVVRHEATGLTADSHGVSDDWYPMCGELTGDEALRYLRDPSVMDGSLFPQVLDDDTIERVAEVAEDARLYVEEVV